MLERQNEDIRKKIETSRLKYWQIAQELGISAERFSIWLRSPLDQDRRKRVISAINKCKEK